MLLRHAPVREAVAPAQAATPSVFAQQSETPPQKETAFVPLSASDADADSQDSGSESLQNEVESEEDDAPAYASQEVTLQTLNAGNGP